MLKSALALVVAGLILGVPLAFWSYRAGATLVPNFGGEPVASVAWAAGGMMVVAFVAAYPPARRAARVQPIGALRHS